ncbi:hypothetical protein GGQ94_003175 [Petrimonas sulfuriphila]
MDIKCGFAVRHESEIVRHPLQLTQVLLDRFENLLRTVKRLPLEGVMAGGTHLTVDTCIGTNLIPGDIIDPQALAQSSGGYGSKTDHRFFFLFGSVTTTGKSAGE